MKKVIDTTGYGTSEGFADQITLPNGHYLYTGVDSINSAMAKDRGCEVKSVRFFGACMCMNINERALSGFPIQIDEVSVADFKDKIASREECLAFFKEVKL